MMRDWNGGSWWAWGKMRERERNLRALCLWSMFQNCEWSENFLGIYIPPLYRPHTLKMTMKSSLRQQTSLRYHPTQFIKQLVVAVLAFLRSKATLLSYVYRKRDSNYKIIWQEGIKFPGNCYEPGTWNELHAELRSVFHKVHVDRFKTEPTVLQRIVVFRLLYYRYVINWKEDSQYMIIFFLYSTILILLWCFEVTATCFDTVVFFRQFSYILVINCIIQLT
jgi:hypothetical protein